MKKLIFIMFFMGLITVVPSSLSAQIPADGLVAWYPFNGNANDESGNGYHAQAINCTLSADRQQIPNSCYSLNGQNSYIQFPSTPDLGPGIISVSMWFNVASSGFNQTILRRRGSGYSLSYNLIFALGSAALNNLNCGFYPSENNAIAYSRILSNPGLNVWHHWAFTYDGLNYLVYLDGVLVYSSNQLGAGQMSSGNEFTLGRDGANPNFYFNGKGDDLAIYNRALTAQEIQALYLSGQAPCTPVTNAISATIIEGETYTLGTQTLTTAGTYTEVFTSAAGCDSTVTLTLSVEPLLTCEVNSLGQEICIGEEIDIICSSNYMSNGNVPLSIDGFLGPYFFNGHSYFASIDSYYWIDAKNLAQQSGGYLVIPNDIEETNFLVSQVFSEPTTQYIGISDELVEGDFVDVFGDSLTFQNWSQNEPNNFMNNNEDYVEMYFNGLWNDLQGGPQALQWPFVIEFNSQIAAIAWSTNETTPSITVSPAQTTTYTATVTTATQTCTDSISITVNPLLTWHADADADGFGNPDDVVQDCSQPLGYIADNTDCNDEDAVTYPGAAEICDNNRDENCDGADSLCFVAILGCTDVNACNFNPEANTNDGSCILPQPETCNGLDDNCNGQVDEGFSIPTINAVAATPALYPTCTGNALKSANLLTGTDSPVIAGSGPDLWYSFTAQYNTLRVGLSAAFGDNSIGLYTNNNGCLELITEEHEVYTASTTATGNQILLTDQLTVGQTYYVAVHQITGPANASAKVCFTYLNESSCDHYYSNNTGIYTNVCNSFKAQYRANATNYLFNVLSGTQNGVNMNLTPWTYTNNNSNSVVARLGSILPANHSGVSRVYTLSVPTVYGLTDAAGNVSSLVANATSTCTVTLNSENTIALRSSDRCPTNKSLTSTSAPDRTVCGAMRYDWEFTEVLPNPGTAQVVQGGNYTTVFFLSNIPGITAGKTYSVRVRPVHSSGIAGQWGSVQCLRMGAAGMVNHPGSADAEPPLLSLRAGGEMDARYAIYPNPTSTGSFVLQYNEQETGNEETSDEERRELVMLDITGKVVFKTQVVIEANVVEIEFGSLASGVYVVMVGEERMRLVVQ